MRLDVNRASVIPRNNFHGCKRKHKRRDAETAENRREFIYIFFANLCVLCASAFVSRHFRIIMATVQDIEIRDSAARTAAAVEELEDIQGERMVLNMGPSHPATHGVLRR